MVADIQNLDKFFNQTNKDDDLQMLLENVYENIDDIMEAYDHILNPTTNKLTRGYIDSGHNIKEAYALSFTCTLSLYINLLNT